MKGILSSLLFRNVEKSAGIPVVRSTTVPARKHQQWINVKVKVNNTMVGTPIIFIRETVGILITKWWKEPYHLLTKWWRYAYHCLYKIAMRSLPFSSYSIILLTRSEEKGRVPFTIFLRHWQGSLYVFLLSNPTSIKKGSFHHFSMRETKKIIGITLSFIDFHYFYYLC